MLPLPPGSEITPIAAGPPFENRFGSQPEKGTIRFRPEVMAAKASRLQGEVAIFTPVSWQLIGLGLLAVIASSLLYLALGKFSRTATVSGTIMPDKGLVIVGSGRPGTVASIAVALGDRVRRGQVLGTVNANEVLAGGQPVQIAVTAELMRQQESVAAQRLLALRARQAQLQRSEAQQAGMAAEIASIQSQAELQETLVASAARNIELAAGIAGRGFISEREMQNRREILLSRRQALLQLQQALAVRRAGLEEARRALLETKAEAEKGISQLDGTMASLAQQLVAAQAAGGQVLAAPVDGQVAAVSGRVGQRVSGETPIFTIVPTGSSLQAEFSVPSAAIGFIRPGQRIRVAVDSFPHQQFGTIEGSVIMVGRSGVDQLQPDGTTGSMYQVHAVLDRAYIDAFGRRARLLPGMKLSARIVTERQTFLHWLFGPLFAMRRD